MKNTENRKTILPESSEFVNRWSPRSFDKNFKLSNEDLNLCLEAARWSYSSRNLQPWIFISGKNGDNTFKQIFDSLVVFNQNWAKNVSSLIIALTPKENEKDNFFDCGAACMSLSLQAQKLGLHTHLIGGFEKEKIQTLIPENYVPVCVIGLGKMGDGSDLDEFNKERETPSTRKSLDEISFDSFNSFNKVK